MQGEKRRVVDAFSRSGTKGRQHLLLSSLSGSANLRQQAFSTQTDPLSPHQVQLLDEATVDLEETERPESEARALSRQTFFDPKRKYDNELDRLKAELQHKENELLHKENELLHKELFLKEWESRLRNEEETRSLHEAESRHLDQNKLLLRLKATFGKTAAPVPSPTVPVPPKYPLVLCHGLGGDKPLYRYFQFIPEDLESVNCRVFTPKVPRYGTVYNRAECLAAQVYEVLEKTGADKVNLIGHSMGGLDSRHFITHLGGHKVVASLITLGTPHHGSAYGDWCAKMAEFDLSFSGVRKMNKLLDKLPQGIKEKLLVDHSLDKLDFELSIDKLMAKLPFEMKGHHHVTRKFLREVFNPQTPDHESVSYFSLAGHKPMSKFNLLFLPSLIVTKEEGPNDGLVSVESSKWGTYLKTLNRDHIEMINWGAAYDARRLYRWIANFLAERDF